MDFPPLEVLLMQKVKSRAGDYLDAFAPTNSIPESWWAALTANESGGDTLARRFEPSVYRHLVNVWNGDSPEYGAIKQSTLVGFGDAALRDLATSWGFTQCMGYHVLRWNHSIWDLQQPALHYQVVSNLASEFISRFGLDPKKDFEELFRCWNSGSPGGQTFAPNYVSNGFRRMEIWDSLHESS